VDLSQPGTREPRAEHSARPPTPGSYRVVRGDTLYAIAFGHGLDYREVAAWNHIAPPYRIYAGQELRLQPPAGTAGAAPVAVARAPLPPPAAHPPGPAPAHASEGPGMFETVPAAPAAPAPAQASPSPSPPAAAPASAPAPARQAATPPPAATPAVTPDSVATGAGGIAWRWPGKGTLIGTYVAGDQLHQGIDIAGQAGDPVLAAADGDVVYSGNGLLGYGELIIVKHNASYLSAYGHNRKRLVQEGEHVRGGQQIAEMGSSASSRDELHFEIRKNGKPVNPLDYLPGR
jgi:lipoprotein NlpD